MAYRADWHYGHSRHYIETDDMMILFEAVGLPAQFVNEARATLRDGHAYAEWSWWTLTVQ